MGRDGCSSACRQLLLLLWRNSLIRWRTGSGNVTVKYGRRVSIPVKIPFFHLLEISWPIILYAILAILRNKFPAQHIPDSKYRAYAMPSAGALPFLQTLFCDLGAGKDNGSFSDMPTYPNATVNGMYSVLDEIGTWNARWSEVCDSIHSLAGQYECLNDGFSNAKLSCSFSNPDSIPLSCYLKNSTAFADYLSTRLNLSMAVVDGILGATVHSPQVFPPARDRAKRQQQSEPLDLLSLLENIGFNSSLLKVLVCDTDQLDGILDYSNISAAQVQSELCQLSDSQWIKFGAELQNQLSAECSPVEVVQSFSEILGLQQLLQQSDLVQLLQGFSDVEWSVQDSDTAKPSASCQSNIDQYIPYFCGTRKNTKSVLQSIINRSCNGDDYQEANHERQRGSNVTSTDKQNSLKILYAPHNDVTLSIIKKANRTFETVGDVIKLADQVANCSQFFLDNFNNDSLTYVDQVLKDTIDARENGVATPLFGNLSLDSLIQAEDLLNASKPDNIWSIMTQVRDASASIHDSLAQFDWDIFMAMKNEQEVEALAGDYLKQDELGITYVIAGVLFEQDVDSSGFNHSIVRIRTNFSAVVDTTQYREKIWYPGPQDDRWKARYIEGFFIFVQDMIERAMVEEIVGERVASPGVYIQEVPYPCYKEDPFTISMLYVLPLAMLFAWLFPVAMTTRAVVREKETRLKEFMKMMGVSEGLLRVSWFLHSLAVLLVSVVGITLLLKLGGILPATDGLILFLFLMLYAVVMLSYSFLVSVFFNNANLAACVAALLYFLVFFGHVSIVPNLNSFSPFAVGLCCLWAPLAFGLGATFIAQWELKQQGVVWNNISIPAIDDDHLSLLAIAGIMALDAVLYSLITWYIEGVFPGRYGVSKPWYFPVMRSYWTGKKYAPTTVRSGRVQSVNQEEDEVELMSLSSSKETGNENCEDEPDGLSLGISIQRLSKQFSSGILPGRKKKTLAVDDLSLNFYEGQITAFLGHNGAGKTTTMSMLTGLYEPSQGTAHIYGNNIRRKMDIIRKSLGMCPQHNILIDELTVEEHLWFYGQLKGLGRKEVKVQIPMWLKKVDLDLHAHKYSKYLSGGMKRKLSILLSFIGNSKTIILDEPTSGVDPYSRQQIWDFLLRHREGRTIMLSTHHMEEAEILGDRIAIISKGSLLCCGSFDYLKHRFGEGHRLTLVTKMQSDRRPSVSSRTFTVTAEVEEPDEGQVVPDSALCEEHSLEESTDADLTHFIQQHVNGASLIERRGREVHYRLPLLNARPHVLASLFAQLDLQKGQLGVTSYGLNSCTMEEVFVKLTVKEEHKNEMEDSSSVPEMSANSQTSLDTEVSETNALDEEGLLFGDTSCDDPLGSGLVEVNSRLVSTQLWLTQFYALIVKRMQYTKGKLVALTIQNVFPLLVICFSLLIAHILQSVSDPPPLELSPHLFFATSRYNYLFVGGYYTDATAPFVNSLYQPFGVAARPVGECPKDDKCDSYPQQQYTCSCDQCSVQASPVPNQTFSDFTPTCYNKTCTGSRILNLTESYDPLFPEAGFYTLHNYLLRSTDSFIQQRYGGVSMGHQKSNVDAKVDALNANAGSDLPFLATHSVAKAWYSFRGYHAVPAYLNTLNNAILRGSLKGGNGSYGIRTISHPFKLTALEKSIYAITENVSFLVNPLAAIFCLGFVVAGFVLLPIEERSGNIKHLQLVCGMNKVVYWVSTFVWDLLWYIAFIVLMLILFLLFQDPYYTGAGEVPVFCVVLLCYGLAAIPWMYLLSFLFTSSATAYVLLFCLNFFAGFSFLIVDAILVQLEGREGNNLLHYYLLGFPFPAYALARSMMFLNLDWPLFKYFATFSSRTDVTLNPFSKLWPFILSLLIQSCCYSSIIIFMEISPVIAKAFSWRKKLSLPIPCNEDESVAKERRRVMRSNSEDLLVVRNLTKIYGNRWSSQYRLAVNQLCLKMKKAECFGLLGVNGAGKTSTFRMLTGDTFVTSGEATIGSRSVANGAIHHSIGYCPQVDALIDTLTGREHLTFYCRLRGLPNADVRKVVEWALIKLGLQEHSDKQVKAYSGGNRRKLSTAIALLAKPALILLDEPTSGVDPRARQFLWTIVRGLVSAGQSVLLTTHSMAECEALCSRVGIMVNGSFCCLGSPQQLKSTYGQGYRLKIRTSGQAEAVKEFIRQNISSASLKEEHYNVLLYQLPSVDLKLSAIYETMESAKKTLDIEDYSLNQTTLNDVFIHFANDQREDVGLHHGNRSADNDVQVSSPAHLKLPDIVTDIPT